MTYESTDGLLIDLGKHRLIEWTTSLSVNYLVFSYVYCLSFTIPILSVIPRMFTSNRS